jgi:hypothetical protein
MAELQKVNLGFPHRRTHSFNTRFSTARFGLLHCRSHTADIAFPSGM